MKTALKVLEWSANIVALPSAVLLLALSIYLTFAQSWPVRLGPYLTQIAFACGSLFALALLTNQLYICVQGSAAATDLKRELGALRDAVQVYAGNRDALSQLGVIRVWPHSEEAVAAGRLARENCSEIFLIGIANRRWAQDEREDLTRLLSAGCRIRILVSNPESEYISSLARHWQSASHTDGDDIVKSVEHLRQAAERASRARGGSLEVRLTSGNITCRLEIIDSKVAFWTPYLPPAGTGKLPCFQIGLDSGSGAAKALWEHCEALWIDRENKPGPKWPQ